MSWLKLQVQLPKPRPGRPAWPSRSTPRTPQRQPSCPCLAPTGPNPQQPGDKGEQWMLGAGVRIWTPHTTPFSPHKLEGRMERVKEGVLGWVDTRFFLCHSFSSSLSVSVAVQVSLSGLSLAPSFCFCFFSWMHTQTCIYTHLHTKHTQWTNTQL